VYVVDQEDVSPFESLGTDYAEGTEAGLVLFAFLGVERYLRVGVAFFPEAAGVDRQVPVCSQGASDGFALVVAALQ
jgi:hypothetical protein